MGEYKLLPKTVERLTVLQAKSPNDFWRHRTGRIDTLGTGRNFITGVDYVLLLYLERREMDRKSGLLHGPISLRASHHLAHPRCHTTGRVRRHQVLRDAESVEAQRVRSVDRCRDTNIFLVRIGPGNSGSFRKLQ